MPFTLCHPALVLPLHRYASRLTVLSALVIGSMAPDFVYFLPFATEGAFTHSLPGIVGYCLPAGALAYLVYHALVREAFIAWAPLALSRRMDIQAPWVPPDLRGLCLLLMSIMLGAASHVAWDAFTHANTAVVRHVDLLRAPVSFGAHAVPLFRILQHVSSLLGAAVIAAACANWIFRTEPRPPPVHRLSAAQRLWVVLAVGAAAAGGGAAGLLLGTPRSVERELFNLVVTGMAAAAAMILVLCAVWRIARHRARSAA